AFVESDALAEMMTGTSASLFSASCSATLLALSLRVTASIRTAPTTVLPAAFTTCGEGFAGCAAWLALRPKPAMLLIAANVQPIAFLEIINRSFEKTSFTRTTTLHICDGYWCAQVSIVR